MFIISQSGGNFGGKIKSDEIAKLSIDVLPYEITAVAEQFNSCALVSALKCHPTRPCDNKDN